MALGKPLPPPPPLPDAKPLATQAPKAAPISLSLTLSKGERIALVGNSTAERMNLFGNFETLLHQPVSRQGAGRSATSPGRPTKSPSASGPTTTPDSTTRSPRSAPTPSSASSAGTNRSPADGGVEKFKADYEKFLDDYAKQYRRDDGKRRPRFVLVSPIAFEPTGDPIPARRHDARTPT